MSTVRIELLGGFRVLDGGRPIGPAISGRQQQLLACLLLGGADGSPVPRALIASRLWPESTDAQALTNLRREWHHLREIWPAADTIVETGPRTLAWRPGAAESDVQAFEAAATRGLAGDRAALADAARLYGGDLLPACRHEWIDGDRERLRQRAREVLTRLVAACEDERAAAELIAAAQQLLRIDGLDEAGWRGPMRGHALRGERATALHIYQQCAGILKQDLNVSPGAATRRLYREILDLDEDAPTAPPPPAAAVFPLIGRQVEWASLQRACITGDDDPARLVLVRGEAGMGKTRLIEELADWRRARRQRIAATRCYAGNGRLAYAPLAAWLQSDAVAPALQSLDAAWLDEIARLRPDLPASRPGVRPAQGVEPWQRTRLFEALARGFQAAAPLVLVLDDGQWADADTLDWLQYFLRDDATRGCVVVVTARAEEERDNRALVALLREMERLERVSIITLGPLDEAATATLAEAVAGGALDRAVLARVFERTEGHPLFVVEQGRMGQSPGGDAPTARVQAVVAERLGLLSADAREVAEVAAAIGRDFAFDILADVSDLEEPGVVRALDELWQRYIVRVQADGRWDFSHDRIREVAYEGVGPARRRLVHRRIAQALERLHAADLDAVSATIASHLDRGGQPIRAIPFLERAADVAGRVSATEEVIRCLNLALALAEPLPPGRDRDQQELRLRTALSAWLSSARGYASVEVEDNLTRILALMRTTGGPGIPARWLWALWSVRYVLGDMHLAREAAEQTLAASGDDAASLCEAHHAMGSTLTSLGDLDAGRAHFAAALDAFDEREPRQSAIGSDLGVFVRAFHAHTLWLLGRGEEAHAQAAEAIARARRLDHPYSLALALAYAGITYQMSRDRARVAECAGEALALCERHGFAYYDDWARILLGWLAGTSDRPAEGVALIEQGLASLDAQRARTRRPYYLSLFADTLDTAGNRSRAAAVVETAIELAGRHGDRWWLPELVRQRARLAAER